MICDAPVSPPPNPGHPPGEPARRPNRPAHLLEFVEVDLTVAVPVELVDHALEVVVLQRLPQLLRELPQVPEADLPRPVPVKEGERLLQLLLRVLGLVLLQHDELELLKLDLPRLVLVVLLHDVQHLLLLGGEPQGAHGRLQLPVVDRAGLVRVEQVEGLLQLLHLLRTSWPAGATTSASRPGVEAGIRPLLSKFVLRPSGNEKNRLGARSRAAPRNLRLCPRTLAGPGGQRRRVHLVARPGTAAARCRFTKMKRRGRGKRRAWGSRRLPRRATEVPVPPGRRHGGPGGGGVTFLRRMLGEHPRAGGAHVVGELAALLAGAGAAERGGQRRPPGPPSPPAGPGGEQPRLPPTHRTRPLDLSGE